MLGNCNVISTLGLKARENGKFVAKIILTKKKLICNNILLRVIEVKKYGNPLFKTLWAQSFTSLKADLRQDLNRVFAFP